MGKKFSSNFQVKVLKSARNIHNMANTLQKVQQMCVIYMYQLIYIYIYIRTHAHTHWYSGPLPLHHGCVCDWCVQDDPFWTVQSMSPRELRQVESQRVCSLQHMLRLAASSNRTAILRLRRPPPQHPRHQTWLNDTLGSIRLSGIPQHMVPAQGVEGRPVGMGRSGWDWREGVGACFPRYY